jgi:hypothetical protein
MPDRSFFRLAILMNSASWAYIESPSLPRTILLPSISARCRHSSAAGTAARAEQGGAGPAHPRQSLRLQRGNVAFATQSM